MIIHKPIFDNFEFGQAYHLYTRVSGEELIFRKEKNYYFFLEKISKYLLPIMDIYAYCLMPKQFSLLVCFRSQQEICRNLQIEETALNKEEEHKLLMQPLSNLLNSYAKAYNKMYQRKGALFVDFIRREKYDDEDGLKEVMRNIHQFPVQRKLVKNITDWKFSSYRGYLESLKPTKVERSFMSGFFEDEDDFINFHKHF